MLKMPVIDAMQAARFWLHVQIGPDDVCWPWKRPVPASGYGRIWIAHRLLPAPRVAYFLATGIDPGSRHVRHACHNPACCNPAHLFLDTAQRMPLDSAALDHADGQAEAQPGLDVGPERSASDRHPPHAKLTLEQVQDIRAAYAAGGVTRATLAKRYGVNTPAIGDIVKGRAWRHAIRDGEPQSLPDPPRRFRRGSSHGKAKLTEDDVRQIRALHEQGETSISIAARFHITATAVYSIVHRRTWRHVE